MGNKYDNAIARIDGVRKSIKPAAEKMMADAPISVRNHLMSEAILLETVMSTVEDIAIGKFGDKTDEELAEVIILSYGVMSAIAGIAGV